MKIEKINDTQIRCTLTGDDLDSMNVKLTDLILKKDKSRALFEDILETALNEFNFKPGDSPMMIEAMPVDDNSVVLTFTIVDGSTNKSLPFNNLLGGLDNTSNFTDSLGQLLGAEIENTNPPSPFNNTKTNDKVCDSANIFSFRTIGDTIDAVQIIRDDFLCKSNLHFDSSNNLFILSLFQDNLEHNMYNKICNTLCEFGVLEVCNTLSLAYLNEYCQPISLNNAVELLGQI